MILTEEEMYLMTCFDYSSRENAITGIKLLKALGVMDEAESESCSQLLRKLEKMSDEVFGSFDFSIYNEE